MGRTFRRRRPSGNAPRSLDDEVEESEQEEEEGAANAQPKDDEVEDSAEEEADSPPRSSRRTREPSVDLGLDGASLHSPSLQENALDELPTLIPDSQPDAEANVTISRRLKKKHLSSRKGNEVRRALPDEGDESDEELTTPSKSKRLRPEKTTPDTPDLFSPRKRKKEAPVRRSNAINNLGDSNSSATQHRSKKLLDSSSQISSNMTDMEDIPAKLPMGTPRGD